MRKGSLIGLLAAAALSAVGFAMPIAVQKAAVMEQAMKPAPSRRQQRLAHAPSWARNRPTPRSRTHTGGGSRMAHRIWKKRRASGRA